MNQEIKALAMEYAVSNMNSGLNCAESVYDALVRSGALEGISPETRAMAIGFGGGIGLSGYTCGALSASIMAVSAIHGRKDPWQKPADERKKEIQQKYYRAFNNIVHTFEELNDGKVMCKDICAAQGGWTDPNRKANCRRIVGAMAGIACDYIAMSDEEAQALPYGDNMVGLK